jgi:hypothetical protein
MGMKQSCGEEEINNQAQSGGDVENIGDTYNGGGSVGTASANSGASVAGIIGMAVGGVVLVAAVAAFLVGKAVSTVVDTFGCLFCGLSSSVVCVVFRTRQSTHLFILFHNPAQICLHVMYFAATS